MTLFKSHFKFKLVIVLPLIWSVLILLQNASPVHSFNVLNGLSSVERLSLVILLSAKGFLYANSATIRDGKHKQIEASVDYSEEILTIRPRVLRRRFSRQMSFLAPALQTMGCLPKFFCGMNSKKPSDSTSTLNDLAYLIKFAMVDDEDSSENDRGKDDRNSDSDSEEEEKEKLDQKFEQIADEELILEDPEYLKFIWKDTKKKIRNKFKDGMDKDILNQMISDMDAESNPKPSYKIPSLFSGLKSLVRFGRSADSPGLDFHNSTRSRRRRMRVSKAFWDTEAFDEQMKLAARIGQSVDKNNEQCTSTFSVCPYTIQQMKNMVTGGKSDDKNKTITRNKFQQPSWFDSQHQDGNVHNVTHPTTPNPMSHAIYLLNPDNIAGIRPHPSLTIAPPASPTTTSTTSRPPTHRPSPTTQRPQTTVKPQKPYIVAREPEDDESGFDNPAAMYGKDVILPSSTVQVIKTKNKEEDESDEIFELSTSSEEEEKEEPLNIPPKFKSNAKTKVTKLTKNASANKTDKKKSGQDEEDASSEEEAIKVVGKKPQTKLKTSNKKQKIKIGLPRPKYTIQHKYRNRPLSTEQGMDKMQTKKKQVIAASSEENESLESEESKNNKANSEESNESQMVGVKSEEKPSEVKIADKLKLNSKKPHQRYKLKQVPKNRLEFKKIENSDESLEDNVDEDQEKKKAEMQKSSEEENGSSEEIGVPSIETSTMIGNLKGSEEKDSQDQSQHPKPSMHPIKYSYYNKNPGEQNQRPGSKPTAGGLLSSLFGGNKKEQEEKPRPHPGSQHNDYSKVHTESESQNDSPETGGSISKEKEDSSEEKPNSNRDHQKDTDFSQQKVPHTTARTEQPTTRPSATVPTVYERPSETEEPKKPKKDVNRPVITDPNDKVMPATPSKFPTLPRFPPPSRRPETSTSSTTQISTTTASSRKDDDDSSSKEEAEQEEKSAEADSSSSKELEDKTAESKESSEEDPNHVKNIFTKGSISSLGEGSDDHKTTETPSPPPPIANWKPANTDEIKTNFKNISKSPNALATLVTPIHHSSTKPKDSSNAEFGSDEKPPGSEENKEDDSMEVAASKEMVDKRSEEESSEEDKRVQSTKKGEDDEADNREPLIVPNEDDIQELGDDVVSLNAKPGTFASSSDGLPAPALAPVSNFDKNIEIKVPMVPPTATPNKTPTLVGTKNEAEIVSGKTVPNAGPASGGLPGGGLPGAGSPPGLGNGPGRIPNPGGGNRMPGGGNSGGGTEGNRAEESSEEKSEEEIGKSSEEEKDKTSEEDDEDDGRSGRTGLNKTETNKTFSKTQAKSVKEDKKSENVDPSIYGSHTYPPLPPIYQWKSHPTLMSKLMKSKTMKPRLNLRLPKPTTTKDTFYSKPLSPMLVQYLRKTYGNSYVLPNKKKSHISTTTTTTSKPKSKNKQESTNSFTQTFERAKLGGNQASDVIHLDEFEHTDNEFTNHGFGHRIGTASKSSKISKTKRRRRPVPPVYGKNTFHG